MVDVVHYGPVQRFMKSKWVAYILIPIGLLHDSVIPTTREIQVADFALESLNVSGKK